MRSSLSTDYLFSSRDGTTQTNRPDPPPAFHEVGHGLGKSVFRKIRSPPLRKPFGGAIEIAIDNDFVFFNQSMVVLRHRFFHHKKKQNKLDILFFSMTPSEQFVL